MNTNREHSWTSERTRSSGSITGPSRVVCNVDNTLISAYVESFKVLAMKRYGDRDALRIHPTP